MSTPDLVPARDVVIHVLSKHRAMLYSQDQLRGWFTDGGPWAIDLGQTYGTALTVLTGRTEEYLAKEARATCIDEKPREWKSTDWQEVK